MNWEQSCIALNICKEAFANLPLKTKDNAVLYEKLAQPLRLTAKKLHSIRIELNILNKNV